MIALRDQEHTTRSPHRDAALSATAQRLRGYVQALGRRRRALGNIHLIFRDQPRIYPLQVATILDLLAEMRRVALACHAFLQAMPTQQTEQLRPYGCLLKLTDLDYLLTEAILRAAMFAEVCDQQYADRVHQHLTIRAALPALVSSYDDTMAMLAALAEKAHQESWNTAGEQRQTVTEAMPV